MKPTKRIFSVAILSAALALSLAADAFCDTKDSAPDSARVSPKSPWGEFTVVEEREKRDPWYIQVLLWLPNRVMDFVDIFHVDVGVGPSYGAVLRVSKYAQLGYRHVGPASVRFGDFGRRTPFLVERSNEYGFGPGYVVSKDRTVCPGEVGAGADLFIAGLYGGVCVDQVFDFIAGVFFIDLDHDDIR